MAANKPKPMEAFPPVAAPFPERTMLFGKMLAIMGDYSNLGPDAEPNDRAVSRMIATRLYRKDNAQDQDQQTADEQNPYEGADPPYFSSIKPTDAEDYGLLLQKWMGSCETGAQNYVLLHGHGAFGPGETTNKADDCGLHPLENDDAGMEGKAIGRILAGEGGEDPSEVKHFRVMYFVCHGPSIANGVRMGSKEQAYNRYVFYNEIEADFGFTLESGAPGAASALTSQYRALLGRQSQEEEGGDEGEEGEDGEEKREIGVTYTHGRFPVHEDLLLALCFGYEFIHSADKTTVVWGPAEGTEHELIAAALLIQLQVDLNQDQEQRELLKLQKERLEQRGKLPQT